MDLLVLISGFLVLLLGAFAGSFLCTLIVTGYGIATLERKLKSLENKIYGDTGVQARAQQGERMGEAMAKAALVMKDESIPKEEKTKALMQVALEYPDVAMQLVKKIGLKGIL